jgi:HSP20 family protein
MTETSNSSVSTPTRQPSVRPAVNVVENASGITVYADLPGVPKDKLNIHVDADTLQIDAEVDLPIPENAQPLYAEFNRKRFHRAFTLSRELDTSRIAADFRDGVLRLDIPKLAEAQPRRITVNAA